MLRLRRGIVLDAETAYLGGALTACNAAGYVVDNYHLGMVRLMHTCSLASFSFSYGSRQGY